MPFTSSRSRVLAVVGALVLALTASACETAPHDSSLALSYVNASRGASSLLALGANTSLAVGADSQAARMRDRWVAAGCPQAVGGYLFHTSISSWYDLNGALPSWRNAGENVGVAPVVNGDRDGAIAALHRAYMNSPEHRANIMNPAFSVSGVGIVYGPTAAQRQAGMCPATPTDSFAWSTEVFLG